MTVATLVLARDRLRSLLLAAWHNTYFRFIVMLGPGTGLYWIIFSILIWSCGTRLLLAWTIVAGMMNYVADFFFQKFLTFENLVTKKSVILTQVRRYILFAAVLISVNAALMSGFATRFGIQPFIAQAVAGVLITIIRFPVTRLIFR